MAKRTWTNMEIQIPVELIMEILVKLPVKSLFRFRCVSKLWCSVISDPHFVKAHHALSSSAHPRLLVLFPRRCEVNKISNNGEGPHYKSKTIGTELFSMDYPQHSDCLRQTLYYRRSIRIPAIVDGEISHPVHGLYCLDFHDRVRIWNPTTLESLDIEMVEVKICPCSKFDVTNHFGFDPVDKKHKILSISRLWDWGGKRTSAIESSVFVLEENCWRKLNDCPPDLGETQIQEVVCIDGIIYSAPYGRSLVAFHVRSERFQRIPIPGEAWHTMLIEFAGRPTLSDTYYLPDKEVNEINLWMLGDLEHWTWTRKTCVIRLGEDFRDQEQTITLQGATPAGELLFAQAGFSEPFLLLLYHVESDTLRTIELKGIPRHLRLVQDPFDSWTRVRFHEERLQELPLKQRLGSRLVAE